MIDWKKYGELGFSFCADSFGLNRSLISEGSRQTLDIFENTLNASMTKLLTRSGEIVGDWVVPQEWVVNHAELKAKTGQVLASYQENNLHLMGYSTSIKQSFTKEELLCYVYTDKQDRSSIPYVTSYYERKWGFCASAEFLESLPEDEYIIDISTQFIDSYLECREIVIEGYDNSREILLSSYCCHPSMANNELSGPAVLLGLLSIFKEHKPPVSIRAVIGPETIGAISFISKRIETLKNRCIGGFVLSCIGDDKAYSIVKNKRIDSKAYHAVSAASSDLKIHLSEYGFYQRGSDERQYCSNNVDLDVVCLCRSKFGTYPEYHSSADNLSIISSESLSDSIEWVHECILQLANIQVVRVSEFIGEPFFSKHFTLQSGYQICPGRESLMLRHLYAYSSDNLSLPHLRNIMMDRFGLGGDEFSSILKKLAISGLLRIEKAGPC